MVVSSQGLVLRVYDYQESSIIAKVYMREYGLVGILARGAKKSKRNTYGIIRPPHFLEFQFYYSDHKTLYTLRDYRLLLAPNSSIHGMFKLSISFFMTEILLNTITEEGQPDEDMYDFVWRSFDTLYQYDVNSTYYLIFMLKHIEMLGFLNYDVLGTSESLGKKFNLLASYTPGMEMPKFDSSERKLMYQYLMDIYHKYIPNFKDIRSIETLEQILR